MYVRLLKWSSMARIITKVNLMSDVGTIYAVLLLSGKNMGDIFR